MKKRSRKIVVADDEAIIRLDLREMLTEAGHEVVGEAGNGVEAVSLTKGLRPDLVIMDIEMPLMDGIAAAKKITDGQLAPVLLLTAYSQPETVARAKGSGVLAYLVKPIQESSLFPAMEIALSRWKEMQALSDELGKARESLEMRKLLDRAKGILMAAHGLTEAEAYRRIQQYSMAKRRSIKDIAAAIVRQGTR